MPNGQKIKDLFPDNNVSGTFDSLLEAAADLAKGDWERQFVQDMRDKYEKYGPNMYLSEKQHAILIRIQGGSK